MVLTALSAQTLRHWTFALCCATFLTSAQAVPQQLFDSFLSSPSGRFRANLEWETAGQVGVLRARIVRADKTPHAIIEVPEIRPNPGELRWLDDRWLVAESFLGQHAAGFFYVDAERKRGLLLEIYAVKKGTVWQFDVAYSDCETTFTCSNISLGRTSFFPILIRDAPPRENDYFSSAMCAQLFNGIEAFLAWKQKQRITSFELIGTPAVQPGAGGLTPCMVNGSLELVYFPLSAKSSQELFLRTRRIPLPSDFQLYSVPQIDDITVSWKEDRRFVVSARVSREDSRTSGSQTVSLTTEGQIAAEPDPPIEISLPTDLPTAEQNTQQSPDESRENGLLDDAVDAKRTSGKNKVKADSTPRSKLTHRRQKKEK
jgi:hypothetical protein